VIRFMEAGPAQAEIVSVVFVAPGTGKPIHNDRPTHGLVYYPAGGCGFVFSDGRRLDTEAGSVVYLPRGSSYRVENPGTERHGGCWAINFLSAALDGCAPFLMRPRAPQKAEALFTAAERIRSEKKAGWRAAELSSFYGIISLLQSEYAARYVAPRRRSELEGALAVIRRDYLTENIRVDQLAAQCGMSETYFRRLFGEICGMPPLRYVHMLRVEKAKELIASDMYDSVSTVARLCGFEDDCYFRRVFRRETGMTPTEYRRAAMRRGAEIEKKDETEIRP